MSMSKDAKLVAPVKDSVGPSRCARCSNKVMQKSQAGVVLHARGPITFGADHQCSFRCRSCGADVSLALGIVEGK